MNNNVEAKRYALEAFKISKESLKEKVKTGRILALVYGRLGQYDSSALICERVLPLARHAMIPVI